MGVQSPYEAIFLAHNLRIMSEPRLIGEQHLKMPASGLAGRPLDTFWLNSAEMEETVAVTNSITMATQLMETGGTVRRFYSYPCKSIS